MTKMGTEDFLNDVFGQNGFLDEVELRTVAALGLRLASSLGAVPTRRDEAARYLAKLVEAFNAAIAGMGWRADPALPGVQSKSESAMRALYVTSLWAESRPIGTLFTLLIAGRPPVINVGPPDCYLPSP
jgi:hypothetical protein